MSDKPEAAEGEAPAEVSAPPAEVASSTTSPSPLCAPDKVETTLAIVKPDAFDQKQHVIKMAQDNGFEVAHSQVLQLDKQQACTFYSEHYGKNFFDNLIEFMCSGEVVVLALRKENAVADWRQLLGPTSAIRARESDPESIRAKFGTDNTKNAAHGSRSLAEALAELSYFFPKYYSVQKTQAYLLPHLEKKQIKEIENRLAAWDFTVVATQSFTITDEAEATALATKMLAQQEACTDPSEDEGSYLMPYAMRPHDPALDEPPPQPKATGEDEEEPEPEPEPEPAADGEAAPAEDTARPVTAETLAATLMSGPIKRLLLSRHGAVHMLNKFAGPLSPEAAREAPATAGTVRAMYGVDRMDNAMYCPATPAEALDWLRQGDADKCWTLGSGGAPSAFTEVERTVAIIKPNAYNSGALIKKLILLNGFTIEEELSMKMSSDQAKQFYSEHIDKEFFPDLVSFMTSGSCIAMVLSRPGAILAWRALLGPTNSETAREQQPLSIRALCGEDNTKNAAHGSANTADAEREIGVLFPRFCQYERTLAILKPDVQQRGLTAAVLKKIKAAGFSVIECKRLSLSASEAATFFNPGAAGPRASETAAYMSSGASVVMVLGRLNAVRTWNRLCGPPTSAEARVTAPSSLRAMLYAPQISSEVRNSLHASASLQVANSEIGFFFPASLPNVYRTQGPPQGVDTAGFMERELQATLTKGLTQLCKQKPPHPLRWLADWLKNNNPNKPHVTCPVSPPKPVPAPRAKAPSRSVQDRELVLVLDHSMTLTDPSQSSMDPAVTNQLAQLLVTECAFAHIDIPTLLSDEVSSQSQVGVEIDRLSKSGSTAGLYMLVITALQQEIARTGGKKHVVTGYPRDMDWVRAMEKYVGAPTSVLFLEPAAADTKCDTNDLQPCITYFDKKNLLTRIALKGPQSAKAIYASNLRAKFFKAKPHHLLYVLGPAGAGRSTLGASIANKYDFRHISVEQLMVDEILAKSAVGDQIDQCLKGKRPVDSEIVMALLREAIQKDTCRNFVVDGYPGSIDELAGIERVVGVPCDAAILLTKSGASSDDEKEGLWESTDPARMIEAARSSAEESFPSDQQQAVIAYLREEGKLFEISAEQYEEDVLMDVEAQVLSGCFKARSKVYFVMGGPGSGKSTQCANLVNEYGFKHLSTPELLREEVRSGSAHGEQISELIRTGQPVPPALTVKLLQDAMDASLSQTFLVDGFPKDMATVAAWEKSNPSPELVIVFDCPESELESRLLKRGDPADKPEDVKKRLKSFSEQSGAVIKYYTDKSLVKRVSSVPVPPRVFTAVKKHFGSYPAVPDIIFVLGGPGSGKGTQCTRIAADYGFVHLSAGDLLREEIQQGTKDGAMIAGMIREGKIVPQDVTIRLLQRALHRYPDKNKYLLDGFPRAIGQAKAFEEMVGKAKMILFFDAPDDVLTERLLKRGETSGRTDDNAQAIVKRLNTYHKQSRPVITHYSATEPAGFVQKIDAGLPVDQVYAKVEKVLGNYNKQKIVWVTGQPSSGKTMLCNRLATTHDGVHLNFAELLKAETLSNSQTGKKIAAYVRRQERMPGELVVQVVKAAVDRSEGGLLVLDGFPRQASEAEQLFGAVGQPKLVLYLDATAAGEPDEVSLDRIKQFDVDGDGMLSKEEFAQAGYIGMMLERSGGGATVQAMMKKLKVFSEETLPVIQSYQKLGLVRTIDATQDIESVIAQVGVQL